MEKPRLLKRNTESTVSYSSAPAGGSIDTMTAACVSELMNASTSFHKLHLKVTGVGSFAVHKTLNDLYDALVDHADNLTEGYQGAAEILLKYNDVPNKTLNMVTGLQSKMPYSEIVNELDTVKSSLNSAKYKLKFLK